MGDKSKLPPGTVALDRFRTTFPVGDYNIKQFTVGQRTSPTDGGPRVASIVTCPDGVRVTYEDGRGWLLTSFGYGEF